MHTTPDSTPDERTVVETTATQALTGHTVGSERAHFVCLYCERPLREGDPVHAVAHRNQSTHRFAAAVVGCQQCGCDPTDECRPIVDSPGVSIHADAVLALISDPQLARHQYCLQDVSITHCEERPSEDTSATTERA
jgi:hypothetical protein